MANPSTGRQLGAALRDHRLAQGLGLNETARRAGISKAALSSFERGHHSLRLATLDRVAAAAGTTIGQLMNPTTDQNPAA